MKEINFRIIELPTHQVLLSKDFDEKEDDKPLLVVSLFINGVKANFKLGFSNEKKRNKQFDTFDELRAQEFVDMFCKHVN